MLFRLRVFVLTFKTHDSTEDSKSQLFPPVFQAKFYPQPRRTSSVDEADSDNERAHYSHHHNVTRSINQRTPSNGLLDAVD